MGTITGDYILGRCGQTLNDPGFNSWNKDTIMFPSLLAALRTLSTRKPNCYTKTAVKTMDAGPMQSLPADGKEFIRLLWNLQSDGSTIGRTITTQTLEQQTSFDPNWASAAPDTTIRLALHTLTAPHLFFTVPAATAGIKALLLYAAIPTMGASTEVIPVDDSYEDPLYWYTLAHAYERNTTQGDLAKTQMYMAMGDRALGIFTQTEAQIDGSKPDTNNGAGG